MKITRQELIKKYIDYFESKNHARIKNSSLIPENDPTVLFTTAGMHPLVPFLLGQEHPQGKRLVNVQRCIRTGDIDEVGNTTHHTLFEMLGNWSLGDYFKKEAIEMSFEFLTKVLNISLDRFAVTVFEGDKDAPRDEEASALWQKLGIQKSRIAYLPKKDNWWGPASTTGPCGPDTEMFYWKLNDTPAPKVFDANDKNWVEIWNDVLMGYNKNSDGKYEEAKQKNIDTGMGVERMVTILNGYEDNYLSDMWQPLIKKIEKISGKNYKDNVKPMRIIADHIKASVFIIADGIAPSNIEHGYVLRRLIRRAIRNLRNLDVPILEIDACDEIAKEVIKIYSDYDILQKNKKISFKQH
jgi:alanyl-tRNA synthetase